MKKKIKTLLLLIIGAFAAGFIIAVWDTPTIKFFGRDPEDDDCDCCDDYDDSASLCQFVDDLD